MDIAPDAEVVIPEDMVINLRRPVELGGETYTQIVLREPTADQWSQFDKASGIEGDILAVALVGGIPPNAVRKIGARDLRAGARYIASFLFDAPKTGGAG